MPRAVKLNYAHKMRQTPFHSVRETNSRVKRCPTHFPEPGEFYWQEAEVQLGLRYCPDFEVKWPVLDFARRELSQCFRPSWPGARSPLRRTLAFACSPRPPCYLLSNELLPRSPDISWPCGSSRHPFSAAHSLPKSNGLQDQMPNRELGPSERASQLAAQRFRLRTLRPRLQWVRNPTSQRKKRRSVCSQSCRSPRA